MKGSDSITGFKYVIFINITHSFGELLSNSFYITLIVTKQT